MAEAIRATDYMPGALTREEADRAIKAIRARLPAPFIDTATDFDIAITVALFDDEPNYIPGAEEHFERAVRRALAH